MNELRSDLRGTLPLRMLDLPIDERGYPVPWFVPWLDGKPEFRAADADKWRRAMHARLCWCCGQPLGAYRVFVMGPMCGITRTTAEPPSHLGCARWAAQNCPFLSRPHMTRRGTDELIARGATSGGMMIERNPGVSLLWTTRDYHAFLTDGGPLIRVGDPEHLEFWCEGRAATAAEIRRSIETGLPALEEIARPAGEMDELRTQIAAFERLVPYE